MGKTRIRNIPEFHRKLGQGNPRIPGKTEIGKTRIGKIGKAPEFQGNLGWGISGSGKTRMGKTRKPPRIPEKPTEKSLFPLPTPIPKTPPGKSGISRNGIRNFPEFPAGAPWDGLKNGNFPIFSHIPPKIPPKIPKHSQPSLWKRQIPPQNSKNYQKFPKNSQEFHSPGR